MLSIPPSGAAAPPSEKETTVSELLGSLTISLPSVFHFLAALRRSGSLHVSRDGDAGEIVLDQGRVVAASYGAERGTAALEATMLVLANGQFSFTEGTVSGDPDRSMNLSADEVRALYDKCAALRMRASDPSSLTLAVPHLEQLSDGHDGQTKLSLSRGALRTLMRVDGRRSIRELAHSRGLVRTVEDLVTLREANLIGFDSEAALREEGAPSADAASLALKADQMAAPAAHTLAGPGLRAAAAAAVATAAVNGHSVGLATLDLPRRAGFPVKQAARRVRGTIPPAAPRSGLGVDTPRPARGRGIIRAVLGAFGAAAVLGLVFLVPPLVRRALESAPESDGAPVAAVAPSAAGAASVPIAAAGAGAGARAGSSVLQAVVDEGFTSNQRGWPEDTGGMAWFSDGALRLFARRPGNFVALGVPGVGSLRDVSVAAVMRKVGGPPGGGYGVTLRDQGPGARDGTNQQGRFYVFEVGDRGEFGIWRRDGDRWVDLVPWTSSEAVRPGGEPNQLEVAAFGPNLAFSVNGTRVAALADSALAEGTVGLFAGGDLNEVAVERLVVIGRAETG